MRTWSLICSVIAHVLLVLLILGVSAWVKPQKPPELLPLELELIDTAAGPVAPPQPPNVESPQPEEQKPEPPPEEEPPEPEPVKEDPPEPVEVKPDPPKPPEVKRPDPPKPPEVKRPDPPKPKTPTLQERMEAARKKTSRTVTPPKPPRPDTSRTRELERTLSNYANNSKGVVIPTASSVAGVSAAQMNNYNSYMARCVTPLLTSLWQTLGPDGLGSDVSPVVINFFVAPNGTVQSCVISTPSDNAQMTAAAQALIRELNKRGLPPFSQVGLSTERNASLPIQFTLKYAR